ncbi:autotransporter outer membrane beta-barrel domain-containing protein, partial [Rickettsia sp. MEAM1 (Bemisia tabaci)]|uniref:autotransporter outer membrane beta-barrel domain-containing protein n=3 Tax=unclassified Rickettsia TaxID=114295 RepID=UPI0008308DA9
DPKSAAKDINAELGATFNPLDQLKKNRKNIKNKKDNSDLENFLQLNAIQNMDKLIKIAFPQDTDDELRKRFLHDIVCNNKISSTEKFNLANQIAANNGIYEKDDKGNIIIDNTNLNNNIVDSTSYISNFNPNYKYIISYSTPTEILEKDLTSEIIDITKGFEKDSKGNSYRKFNKTELKHIEQKIVYDLIKSKVESLIESAYGANVKYVDYYNSNINDNSYEKYFTKNEKEVITNALGYKRTYEEKTGLYKSEVDKLDRSILSEEEYLKKCEEILKKIGESTWDSYQVSKPGSSSKIRYEEYEKLVTNDAKKRAVIARFLMEDNNKINGKRLKIVKEDGSEEYIDNTEFNLIRAENNWDLTPANIPLSKVMKDTNNLSENEKVKKLLARIKFLENITNNLDIINELEDAKRQLDELKSKKITGLFALNNNGENASISFDQNLIDILKILKEVPDFVSIIRAHPDLFPTIFNDPDTLAFLEKCSPEDYENIIIELSLLDSKSQDLESLIVKKQISEEVTLHNQVASITNKPIHMGIHGRLLLPTAVITGGDEEDAINRGVWISGLYGVSNQKAWRSIPKYQGRTSGVTIGMDTELSNSSDVIGIAYSRIESHFKYNKKFAKTALNGHLLSVYGLKELPKNFSLQAIASVGHNYIKNKATTANNIIGKYQNNNFNFEALLNYKYRTNYNLYLIPNIGLKYDYSRSSGYKGNNFVQKLMIQKKSNRLLTTSLGGKIEFKSIKVLNDITLVPSLYGSIENHFYNKDTKVNAKAILNNQIIEEKIIISKQPKFGYNIGGNILLTKKNINVIFEYNHYTHKKYKSHQGLVKLKVNL